MPVSCHFRGCKVLLHTGKRRYIKYHAFAFLGSVFLIGLSMIAVWMQYTNVTDRQTDGRTDTGRRLVPRWRIASRCKNEEELKLKRKNRSRMCLGNLK